jgi:hypothetical protein
MRLFASVQNCFVAAISSAILRGITMISDLDLQVVEGGFDDE